jgi:glycosyltransferase involved in cell wall biosynthesis
VLDYLRPSETALLMPHAVPEDWAATLRQIVADPQRLIGLGESARQYVQTQHAASQFVARTLELYHRIATPQALPFPR